MILLLLEIELDKENIMPCRDWDAQDACITQANLDAARAELAKAPKASLLCEACDLLENAGILFEKGSAELCAWYSRHESQELNKVRLEAAEKLTVRERRLLGIDLNALKANIKK